MTALPKGEPSAHSSYVLKSAQLLLHDALDRSQSLVDLGLFLQAGHSEVGLAAALAACDGRDLLDQIACLEALFLCQLEIGRASCRERV